jgi:protein ImuB
MNAGQLWLCLRMHSLALDITCRALSAEQWQRPVAIEQQQRILFVNAAAQAAGIQCGMTTNAARALAHDIALVKRDEREERHSLDDLAQHCHRFTPMVTVRPPDCLLLEIKGCLRLFGGLHALLAQARDSIEALGFHVACGLGHTPQAACLLSHHAALQDDDLLLQRGQFGAGDFLPLLAGVPLALAIGDQKLCQRLQRLGWHCLGDVLQQPPAVLARGLGKPLLDLLRRITGELPDPQLPVQPRADFQGSLQLPFALGSVQALLHPAQRLLQDMEQFLLRRQLTSHGIEWRLRDTRRRIYSLPISVARPQYRASVFLTLTQLKMTSLRLEDDVEIVTLISCRHSPLLPPDGQLFRGAQAVAVNGNGETMHEVLDRLRARLGDDCCRQLRSCDEVLPEMATQARRADDGDDDVATASPQLIGESAERPLWLLPQPQKLQGLHYHGALRLVSGPQRLQSYWWSQAVKRDYYRALRDDGTLFWVYRQLPDGPWYLHGIYS